MWPHGQWQNQNNSQTWVKYQQLKKINTTKTSTTPPSPCSLRKFFSNLFWLDMNESLWTQLSYSWSNVKNMTLHYFPLQFEASDEKPTNELRIGIEFVYSPVNQRNCFFLLKNHNCCVNYFWKKVQINISKTEYRLN